MTFHTSLAIAIVTLLAIGASPDALTAQDKKAIPGDTFIPGDAFTPDTGLREIPGDTFTPMRLRQFKGQGIVTAGDLVSADPAMVGRILEIAPDRARQMQKKMRASMR
ncbi:hypothetical protein M8756_15480 [Lutimaribacter sp. EGI FJ00015]|uniref:Uncharacterized protein n=1 Tax=Lutimaribacter degradans TaxID=2945989 RepID=A0ACC6A0B6_9RHOB|nr:hypothetical protein [Lutimaribacter sp. EGI FJ00013]MCM2563613.1 hypothetical protein [Lutimaribacter sp. EGI FJ00013]MCO0614721.1 hypothetical protein [Lutimaribacter sp. EGI FJ00015]MCO0637391.1 hypothetical protein [Lutimaribacter sp. EGI FJ00014]